MNNLRKFNNEAEYSAATLNYPAVSWVVSGDTVHYDKETPAPVDRTKVMMAFTPIITETTDIILWNNGATDHYAILSSCTINNVDVTTIVTGVTLDYISILEQYNVVSGTNYVVRYGIDQSPLYIGDEFSGILGGGWGSDSGLIDFFIPSNCAVITNIPENIQNLVVDATTPPDISFDTSGFEGNVYVPDSTLNTYKSHPSWQEISEQIFPISEYSGNLPV